MRTLAVVLDTLTHPRYSVLRDNLTPSFKATLQPVSAADAAQGEPAEGVNVRRVRPHLSLFARRQVEPL